MVCCHRIPLLLLSVGSFGITSKCCFCEDFVLPKNIYLEKTLKCYYVLIVLAKCLKWWMVMDFGIFARIWAWWSLWQHRWLAAWVKHFSSFAPPLSSCIFVSIRSKRMKTIGAMLGKWLLSLVILFVFLNYLFSISVFPPLNGHFPSLVQMRAIGFHNDKDTLQPWKLT